MNEQLGQNVTERVRENELGLDKEIVGTNEKVSELESIRERETDGEIKNKNVSEQTDYKQTNEEDSGNSQAGTGSSSLIGVVGAAVVAVVVMIGSTLSGIAAIFKNLIVYGTFFEYELAITMNYKETDDVIIDFNNFDLAMKMVIAKNGYSQIVNLKTGDEKIEYIINKTIKDEKTLEYSVEIIFKGVVERLEENTRYQISVIGIEEGKTVTYTNKNIKTTGPKTELNGLTYNCTCGIDGKFNYQLDYIDENGYYSNFTYEFKNSKGEIVRYGDILQPNKKQVVEDINNLSGKDYILIIKFLSSAASDISSQNVETKYLDGNLIINSNQGIITITANVKI